ncbi:MAG: HDOD domain-containing protein [Phycisphaeraceae bacterium]
MVEASRVVRHACQSFRILRRWQRRQPRKQSIRLGYRYFQGYFYCKPEIVQVERTIRLEPSLSVKLLRYINTSARGLSHKVSSIQQALALLGERALRQWAVLVVMTCLGKDKPQDLVRICLTRARCCELLGMQIDLKQSQFDLFLLGLLSTLDAMLDRPMAEVLAPLPVADPIKAALLGDSSPAARLHLLVVARERGEWPRAAMLAMLAMLLGLD